MGDQELFQELADIRPLLPEGGREREQAATPRGTASGLDAQANFALNRRLTQCSRLRLEHAQLL